MYILSAIQSVCDRLLFILGTIQPVFHAELQVHHLFNVRHLQGLFIGLNPIQMICARSCHLLEAALQL